MLHEMSIHIHNSISTAVEVQLCSKIIVFTHWVRIERIPRLVYCNNLLLFLPTPCRFPVPFHIWSYHPAILSSIRSVFLYNFWFRLMCVQKSNLFLLVKTRRLEGLRSNGYLLCHVDLCSIIFVMSSVAILFFIRTLNFYLYMWSFPTFSMFVTNFTIT